MEKELDCRGLACPAPVLQTKQLIEKERPGLIKVTLDNEASKQNVSRFLESQNFEIIVEQEGALFHVIGRSDQRGVAPDAFMVEEPETEKEKIVVMVATDRMGYGDDALGLKLMVNFIKTLKEMGDELRRLIFVNNGVKLTIDDSQVVPELKELEENGLLILVCGTCLDHFDLLDRKQVGETTNMLDVVTAMQLADKVINI
jgi:selenium metabolism protein YedF